MDRGKTGAKTLKLDLQAASVKKPKKKLQAVPMTYKDYMVKEEAQKSAKESQSHSQLFNSGLSGGSHRQSHVTSKDSVLLKPKLKTTKTTAKISNKDMKPKSRSPPNQRPTSIEMKREIQVVFDNFMQRLQDGDIQDDDSLLQESNQEPDHEAKQVIVHEQRARREKERQASLEQARAEEQHRLDNLAALNNRFKQQMKDFQKQKVAQKRQKAKQDVLKKKKIDEIVKMHQGHHVTTEVVKFEKAPEKPAAHHSQGSQQQLVELRSWIEQQMRNEDMFNQPDSNELTEVPDFSAPAQKIVTIEVKEKPGLKKDEAKTEKPKKRSKSRDKSEKSQSKPEPLQKPIQSPQKPKKAEHPLKNPKQDLPGNRNLSEEDKAKLPNSRKNRYGVFPQNDGSTDFDKAVENQRKKMAAASTKAAPAEAVFDSESIQEELSADRVSDDSCDQVPVRQSSRPFVGNRREIINKPANLKEQPTMPGVLNIKKEAETQARKQLQRETLAAITIQKWVRGHFGRRAAVKQRAKISRQIEEEYGKFERDVKRSRDYDLKKYLQDKKKIREKIGLPSHESMDSIAEVISDSASTTKAHRVQTGSSAFFKIPKIDKDPLSLISVYVKKHGSVPNLHKHRTKDRRKHRDGKASRAQKGITTSSSIIEEDYPEDFVEDSHTTSTIIEDIPFSNASSIKPEKVSKSATTSKGLVPAVGAVSQTTKAKTATEKTKKQPVKESPLESIADEVESIADEVPDPTPAKKKDSDTEDEIIRDEYDNDYSRVSDAKKKIEARNRLRFGLASDKTDVRSKQQEKKESVILEMGEQREQMALQRQRVLNELLGEMKEYERAHISSTAIDRMEKVVISSMAQKDQVIMAQRLVELEREKKHQEEIVRLREEQIKMMTQMIMLGFGQAGTAVSDKQRQEAMDSMKKLMEQPVTIKQETVHVNYSVNKMPAPIADLVEMSLAEELATSHSHQKRKTYLEEYEESLKKGSESKKVFDDDIEDEIPEEVVPVEEQSIQEEIEQSQKSSNSQSTAFRNNAFQEYKAEKLSRAKATDMHTVLSQIEQSILREKEEREQELKAKLKKKTITNQTYEKRVKEVEKWAKMERKDIQDRKNKDYDYKNVKNLIGDLQQEKKTLAEKIGASPKRSRQYGVVQSEQLLDDSRDSDGVREAIRQSQLLRAGLVQNDPESKYIEKKKQAATSLLEEKEKAIQQGLINKLAALEAENADDMMKRALDINVQSEINKRFELARKIIEESGSVNESSNSNEQKPKKKNVQFAPSVDKQQESEKYHISEESIQESIQHAESVSNSIRSSAVESKNRSTASAARVVSSEVSSEYSEDFDQSAEKDSSASKSGKVQTMTKLQAKAKDLEESNAYSERFDDESVSASQPHKADLAHSSNKMESVKEESIDESIEIETKIEVSAPEPAEKFAVESLPSEDVEIKDSGKSTDWQININDHSRRGSIQQAPTPDEMNEVEEDIDDLNERDEQALEDLQSCPEDIGKSQSDNYLYAQADAIAEDLLRALLDNYKADEQFALTIKISQPDEDEFKSKFPWTLDKLPEPKPKSSPVKKPETPKKVKSEREIADEKFKEEQSKKEAKFEERHAQVSQFMDFMCKRVDLQKLVEALNTPITRDPLKVLKQIQAYEDDESSILQNDSDPKSSPQQVLPYAFFCKVDKEFVIIQRMQRKKITQSQAEESDNLTVSQEDDETVHNIHHYALFEALNDVLDQERPYRTKGEPMPWSTNSRTFKQITTPEQARKILEKARDKVIEVEKTQAGTNLAPMPSAPPQTQDEDGNEIIPPLLSAGEEERKNMQRHLKLAQLMTEDIQENEQHWVDYEIQETQARFDLADMILHHLTGEIVSFLQAK